VPKGGRPSLGGYQFGLIRPYQLRAALIWDIYNVAAAFFDVSNLGRYKQTNEH
jgi:hypothetical protein